jgi:hypothetical protein
VTLAACCRPVAQAGTSRIVGPGKDSSRGRDVRAAVSVDSCLRQVSKLLAGHPGVVTGSASSDSWLEYAVIELGFVLGFRQTPRQTMFSMISILTGSYLSLELDGTSTGTVENIRIDQLAV